MKKSNVFILFFITLFSFASVAQTYLVQVKSDAGKWGYANNKGELVIPAQYDNCEPFSSNGLAVVSKAKVTTIINTKGEEIKTEIKGFNIQGVFTSGPKGFQNGLLAITVNKKWGYLNSDGIVVIPLKYDEATTFDGGFAVVKTGETFMIIDTKGTEIKVPAGVLDVKRFSEGLAPVKMSDKKLGFLNTKGELAIHPQFSSVGYFSGGLAWAKIPSDTGDKVGFINEKGEWVIRPTFAAASDFDPASKIGRVKEGDTWMYVDATGNKIYVKDTESWGDFVDGLAKGTKGGRTGFYNTKGEWIIRPQFDGAREFKNGYAAAKLADKWGVIDTAGNWVVKPTFDGIKDIEKID